MTRHPFREAPEVLLPLELFVFPHLHQELLQLFIQVLLTPIHLTDLTFLDGVHVCVINYVSGIIIWGVHGLRTFFVEARELWTAALLARYNDTEPKEIKRECVALFPV